MDLKNYKIDKDLDFLKDINDEYMKLLIDVLTKGKDGNPRWTEELTETEEYKRWHYSERPWKECCSYFWKLVAAELQKFGGNTIENAMRLGKGVPYREILCDVCRALKVKFDKNSPTERIEELLLNKFLEETIAKMSPEDLEELAKSIGLEAAITKEKISGGLPDALLIAFQVAIRAGKFKAYCVLNSIIHAVARFVLGHGLKWGATAPIMHYVSIVAGPIGWVISGTWTAIWIATPAMRVTIPAAVIIACLRRIQKFPPESAAKALSD